MKIDSSFACALTMRYDGDDDIFYLSIIDLCGALK